MTEQPEFEVWSYEVPWMVFRVRMDDAGFVCLYCPPTPVGCDHVRIAGRFLLSDSLPIVYGHARRGEWGIRGVPSETPIWLTRPPEKKLPRRTDWRWKLLRPILKRLFAND